MKAKNFEEYMWYMSEVTHGGDFVQGHSRLVVPGIHHADDELRDLADEMRKGVFPFKRRTRRIRHGEDDGRLAMWVLRVLWDAMPKALLAVLGRGLLLCRRGRGALDWGQLWSGENVSFDCSSQSSVIKS